jgi:hypothetical protein
MLSKDQKQEVQRRLENWARWRYTGDVGPGGLSPFPAYNLVNISSARAARSTVPTLSGEAEDMDKLLRKMPPRLVRPLTMHYLWNGTPKWKAMRCKCSPRHFYRLVEHAESVFNRLCYPLPRVQPQPLVKVA